MKITSISAQIKNPNRVNISVDGKYRLSLDLYQVTDLGVKVGLDVDDKYIAGLESESEFGKLYARALEYCLMRPHSSKEIRDYLYKKTLKTRYRSRKTGMIMERDGLSSDITNRVFERLDSKGYVDDDRFAAYWVENRNQRKGSSVRKLRSELMAKGVPSQVIDQAIAGSSRDDSVEVLKIIEKKRNKYDTDEKMIQYLVRQGFSYDTVRSAMDK